MITLEEISEKARQLTLIDLQNKSIFALMAKMAEEFGEFARELQIEESVFGNTHKDADEGSVGEAIDMIIMALALYHARHPNRESCAPTLQLAERLAIKLNKWQTIQIKKNLEQ